MFSAPRLVRSASVVCVVLVAGCSPPASSETTLQEVYFRVEAVDGLEVRLEVTGGEPPYNFDLAPGATLPVGLDLSPEGIIAGRPGQLGTFPSAAHVTDVSGRERRLAFVLELIAPDYALPQPAGESLLSAQEREVLAVDPRFGELAGLLGEVEGLTPVVASARRVLSSGASGDTIDLVFVPLEDGNLRPVNGAIVLHGLGGPGGLALAFLKRVGTEPAIDWFGLGGGRATMTFTQYGRMAAVTATVSDDSAWDAFKRWLESEGGANDMPWWYDLLCGVVCGDALIGSHNPWSISACLHCVAGYIAACIEVEA